MKQPRNIILIALEALGGHLSGKTKLQKEMYFISEIIGKDLGFRAHYYGPYSDTIADEVKMLKLSGLIHEEELIYDISPGGFEKTKYEYKITDDSREVVKFLKKKYPEESQSILDAVEQLNKGGEIDYIALSIAAKAYFILKSDNESMTNTKICKAARNFKWIISSKQINEAVEFLEKIDLIKRKKTKRGIM